MSRALHTRAGRYWPPLRSAEIIFIMNLLARDVAHTPEMATMPEGLLIVMRANETSKPQ